MHILGLGLERIAINDMFMVMQNLNAEIPQLSLIDDKDPRLIHYCLPLSIKSDSLEDGLDQFWFRDSLDVLKTVFRYFKTAVWTADILYA